MITPDMIGMPADAKSMLLNMHRAPVFLLMCEAVGAEATESQRARLIRTAKNMFDPKYYEYPERALQMKLGITVTLSTHQESNLDVTGV